MKTVLLASVIAWSIPQFPPWEKVLPEQLAIKTVEQPPADRDLGSVGRWKEMGRPLDCKIVEAGKTVGYRVNC